MKKKYLIITLVICLIISSLLLSLIIIPYFKSVEKNKIIEEELKKIENAIIKIELIEDRTVSFYEEKHVSDFIKAINGTIVDDFVLDTKKLGVKEINFEYINEEDIKIPYKYTINVEDKEPPVIWLGNSYTVNVGYNGSLLEDIMCADNYDDNPICTIEGNFNTNKVGNYNLVYKAVDNSGNETKKNFTLNVVKPTNSSSYYSNERTTVEELQNKFINQDIKIGIDVSAWQGDIDFEKVKNSGIEFAFIRVGGTKGIGLDYFLDSKFIRNIEGFTNVGIPVGIYFYSYAKTEEHARNDALWLLDQIKDYRVDLPIVYDWENWSFYNEFNLSFYSLTKNAEVFMDTIKNAGYEGMLYGSKNYLNKVWLKTDYPTWVAHYTNEDISYKDEYPFWQICSNGLIDGINGNVDMDIMYN